MGAMTKFADRAGSAEGALPVVRNRQSWTDDDNRTLMQMWIEGRADSEIAERLKRSESAIRVKASRLNLPPRSEQRDRFKAKARTCLVCGTSFYSEGPGNRVCDQCKASDDWQSGGACAVHD